MEKKKYVYFQQDGIWIGYWEEFPDYMTQGKSLKELQDNLRDIYKDLTDGSIPAYTASGNSRSHEESRFAQETGKLGCVLIRQELITIGIRIRPLKWPSPSRGTGRSTSISPGI